MLPDEKSKQSKPQITTIESKPPPPPPPPPPPIVKSIEPKPKPVATLAVARIDTNIKTTKSNQKEKDKEMTKVVPFIIEKPSTPGFKIYMQLQCICISIANTNSMYQNNEHL